MAAPVSHRSLEFAFDLHGRLRAAAGVGDLVWSPYSVRSALGLLAAGARGRTRAELVTALRSDGGGTAPDTAARPGLATGTALWVHADLPVLPAYEAAVRAMPGGAVRQAPLRDDPTASARDINADVAKTTRGMIDSIVTPQMLTDSVAVLVNALWAALAWQDPFRAADTRPLDFAAAAGVRRVPAMRAVRSLPYAAADGWAMVSLAGTDDLTLDVLLPPDASAGAPLTADGYARLRDATRWTRVRLALPRFTVDYACGLIDRLAELGVREVFTDGADLSAISTEALKVDQVRHKARLRVDEAGAEGAAATVVGMTFAAAARPVDPTDFVVDRPFTAVLRDDTDRPPYFLAEITDPTDPGPAS